jgi:hypothetical protein
MLEWHAYLRIHGICGRADRSGVRFFLFHTLLYFVLDFTARTIQLASSGNLPARIYSILCETLKVALQTSTKATAPMSIPDPTTFLHALPA